MNRFIKQNIQDDSINENLNDSPSNDSLTNTDTFEDLSDDLFIDDASLETFDLSTDEEILNDEFTEEVEEDFESEDMEILEEIDEDVESFEDLSDENIQILDDIIDEDDSYDEFTEEVQEELEISSLEDISSNTYELLEDGEYFYGIGNNDYNSVNTILIDKQGEAYEDFQGTCGLCSTANCMRLLGVENVTEGDVISAAINEIPPLCYTGDDIYSNGGTNNDNICDIFSLYGCEAEQKPDLSIDDIDSALNSGHAMMMSVKAEYLVNDPQEYIDPYTAQTDHWVTVVGLKKNEDGNVTGVMIKDTGGWSENNIIEMSVDKFNWMRENFDDFTGIEASRRGQ